SGREERAGPREGLPTGKVHRHGGQGFRIRPNSADISQAWLALTPPPSMSRVNLTRVDPLTTRPWSMLKNMAPPDSSAFKVALTGASAACSSVSLVDILMR